MQGNVKTQVVDVVSGDFVEVLKQLGNGKALFQLNKGMNDVVAAIREYPQKGGTITLKIEIAPMKPGDPNRMLVDASVTTKAPQEPGETKIFFTTRNNELVRDDPRQMSLIDE